MSLADELLADLEEDDHEEMVIDAVEELPTVTILKPLEQGNHVGLYC